MARTDRMFEGGGAPSGIGGGAKSFGPYAKSGTRITLNSSQTKVVKVDSEGNVTTRPFVRREIPKGTQANHSVTKVDPKTGKSTN